MPVESVNRYHQRRWKLMSRICGHHIPMCEICGKLLEIDVNELHVHHVNEDEGHESGIGGWQHLLRLEEDFENDVELEVLCSRCHQWRHGMEVELLPEPKPEGEAA